MDGFSNSIRFYDHKPRQARFGDEVIRGLKKTPPQIAPKFFYDKTGSEIFDAICETDEYYLTRTETGILNQYLDEICRHIGPDCLLLEPGSGSSHKVRILLESLRPEAYLPMDISRDHLKSVAQELADEYPWLDIHAACIDYTAPIDLSFLHTESGSSAHKVAFFPGSSIGNFEPGQAIGFLQNIARMVGPGGGLLIGVDLKKDRAILDAAYNDTAGATADFNLNLLHRINDELDADFQIDEFSHRAFYNQDMGRVEMHLVSQCQQTVRVEDERFDFQADDYIHTENSYKYHIDEFQALAQQGGFEPLQCWTDEQDLFSVHYLQARD